MTAFAGFKVATVLNLDFENNVIYNLASKNTDPFCNNNDDLQTHRVGMLFLANTNTTMKNSILLFLLYSNLFLKFKFKIYCYFLLLVRYGF